MRGRPSAVPDFRGPSCSAASGGWLLEDPTDRGCEGSRCALLTRVGPRSSLLSEAFRREVVNRTREPRAQKPQRKLSQGKGAIALFAGPAGTGKTVAAEMIANELSLELYKIDLAGVVSKYIGETGKILIAFSPQPRTPFLFFDEADALFGNAAKCAIPTTATPT
jgi:hypothetical protein